MLSRRAVAVVIPWMKIPDHSRQPRPAPFLVRARRFVADLLLVSNLYSAMTPETKAAIDAVLASLDLSAYQRDPLSANHAGAGARRERIRFHTGMISLGGSLTVGCIYPVIARSPRTSTAE
jgi:hypothetical protein